jgi:hypothetical protein
MKALHDDLPERPEAFAAGLHSRLAVVRDRVGAENVHLDQVAAVAASYVVPLRASLKLVG